MTQNVPAKNPTSAPNALVQGVLDGMAGVTATYFEGLDHAATFDWLTVNGTAVADADRRLGEYRQAIGIGLWHLRSLSKTETAYMADQYRIARAMRVSTDTLTRWRTDAQKALRLPAPSERSKAQQAPPKSAVVDAVSEDVTSGRTSKQERVEGGDSQHGSPTRPGAGGGAVATTEKVAEAEPAVPSPARGSTPSSGEGQPPPVASPSNGPLYPQPATSADVVALFARLETVDDGMLTKSIDGQRLAAQGKRLHRLGAPTVSPTWEDIERAKGRFPVTEGGRSVRPSDCLHPPARRLGSTCSDCGCSVPKDAKWGRRAGRA